MRQSFYRVMISIFAAWDALTIFSLMGHARVTATSLKFFDAQVILTLIGLALLPISVVGLWHLRLWGFLCLVLGFILVMFSCPGAIFFHAFCIVLTILRYCFANREAKTAHKYAHSAVDSADC